MTDKAPLFLQKVWLKHTHTYRLSVPQGCRAIWPMHMKRLDVVRGEVLECFTALSKFVHISASLGCTFLLSHDTMASLTVNKRRDNRTTTERGSEYQHFFLTSCDTDLEDGKKRRERFRNESDAMCHMENKQEGNLSHHEDSGFLSI